MTVSLEDKDALYVESRSVVVGVWWWRCCSWPDPSGLPFISLITGVLRRSAAEEERSVWLLAYSEQGTVRGSL